MRYIDLPEPGDATAMRLNNTDAPQLKAGEVLIKVTAAGVNRPDIVQRQGFYPVPANASKIMGLEVAGEITAIADDVDQWQVGDKVCALCNGGGYAEFVCVPASQCLPIPEGFSDIQAAALPETFFTVWTNVFDRGQLKKGETLLVHGGSSGIGTSAIQMAKAMGATVYITAGSDEKCQACLDLGADVAINYKQKDFAEEINNITDGKGVDVILDMVAGDYVEKNIAIAAEEGRIVHIAGLNGFEAKVNIALIMFKRLQISGSTLRPRTAQVKAQIAKDLREHIWPLLDKGTIKPLIAKTFDLAEVGAAHQLMESDGLIGKIVLKVS